MTIEPMTPSFPELPSCAQTGGEFDAWWHLPGTWVEAPNQCRGGMSGVALCKPPLNSDCRSRIYLKRQINHVFRTLRNPISGLPTAAREARFLGEMRELALKVPTLVYFGRRKSGDTQYAVIATEALDGFTSLGDFYADDSNATLIQSADPMIKRSLAAYLSKMHHAGLQHGCLYPKHIFVQLHENDAGLHAEIALIDLEKMRHRASSRKAATRDLEQFRRHQEFWAGPAWDEFIRLYDKH